MEWGGRWEGGSGWGTCVHPWQMHVDVWQNQYNIFNINRNKIIFKKRKKKNFPQFVVIHTVKGFGIFNKAEVDVFLELSCFFDDPMDVGNLISVSSAFPKTQLEHLEVYGSHTVEAWLGEFCALLF